MTFDLRRLKVPGILAALLASAYLLAWALYWPAYGPLSGIQEPLYYNDSYIWPMAWTLHQAAPGVPGPAPLTLAPGDSAHQTLTAPGEHLAALRLWLAGTRAGEVVRVTLHDLEADRERYTGLVRVDHGGQARYTNLRLPPIAAGEGDASPREFRLDVQAMEGTALLRVGYVDPLPGRLYLNEYPTPGDLDVGLYYRGPPGLWTLRLIGQRRWGDCST